MSWNAIPHRFFVLRELKKSVAGFKNYVKTCQEQYDKKLIECNQRIQRSQEDAKKNIAAVLDATNQKLQKYVDELQNLQVNIEQYVSLHYEREAKKQALQEISIKYNTCDNYLSFLNNLMHLLREEIVILKEQEKHLLQKSDLTDIIRLINQSGGTIDVEDSDTASALLDKIDSVLIATNSKDAPFLYNSLQRLRIKLIEYTDYESELQYVQWKKQQYISIIKSCSIKVRKYAVSLQNYLKEHTECKKAIMHITQDLNNAARTIRMYWMIPLTKVEAIKMAYIEKMKKVEKENKELIKRQKEIQSQQQELKERERGYISDTEKHQIWREKKRLSEEWETNSSSIGINKSIHSSYEIKLQQIKMDSQPWKNFKAQTELMFDQYHILFYRSNDIYQADMVLVRKQRIIELKKLYIDCLKQRKETLNAELKKASQALLCSQLEETEICKTIETIKANDKRPKIIRFIPLAKLKEAERAQITIRASVAEAQKRENSLNASIKEIDKELLSPEVKQIPGSKHPTEEEVEEYTLYRSINEHESGQVPAKK